MIVNRDLLVMGARQLKHIFSIVAMNVHAWLNVLRLGTNDISSGITPFVRKVLRLSLQKLQNSTSQLMLPVPFEVVPSAVNTLLPAFLRVLKAAGECL
jgi:hypothetical protein